ncbi:arsenite methyltransferase-like isoform X1 [Hypanus sabinus]|uniref:arsenite methyltransferase-like isoform X1 n=1 Tax=Hypanus sabinus TaxID=79690 RepID=UPI0028C48BD1|nr:arsenite methyltransferase-like isoform X1 [Hypanus sabinus]
MLADRITRHLGNPRHGLWGWILKMFFERNNRFLEAGAVKLCNIQPGNVVLELGFGPGLGLQEAARRLTHPPGKLYGLDISEYMHDVASERMRAEIQTGKVKLFVGSVEQIPLEDGVVDRVYHCNCYYFWPDLRVGSREIRRVMKPDVLDNELASKAPNKPDYFLLLHWAGALMVTALHLELVQKMVAAGLLKGTKWQPEPYMEALLECGFVDVRMEDHQINGEMFQAIFAAAKEA